MINVFPIGSCTESHKAESLFDPKSPENTNDKKMYCTSLDYHLNTHTEAALLERTPAFALDYLYKLEIPDDYSSDRISELGSDLEYRLVKDFVFSSNISQLIIN